LIGLKVEPDILLTGIMEEDRGSLRIIPADMVKRRT
jgi:hypothetical protein